MRAAVGEGGDGEDGDGDVSRVVEVVLVRYSLPRWTWVPATLGVLAWSGFTRQCVGSARGDTN